MATSSLNLVKFYGVIERKKISKFIQGVGIYVRKNQFKCRLMYYLLCCNKAEWPKMLPFEKNDAAIHMCFEKKKVSSEKFRKIQSQQPVVLCKYNYRIAFSRDFTAGFLLAVSRNFQDCYFFLKCFRELLLGTS